MVAVAIAGAVAVSAPAGASADVGPAVGYGATVPVIGRGFGHGRGMGQWGSLGYAVDKSWSHSQILDHYYGGTVSGAVEPVIPMTVRLVALDGADTIVVQESGRLVSGATGPTAYPVMRAVLTGASGFDVFSGPTCTGPWTKVGASSASVTFTASTVNDDSPNPTADLLGVCEPSGSIRYYRGTIIATHDGSGNQRTVNSTTIERYLRGVVPRESPASWGDSGNGKGINALRAQAVTARSYALAEGRYAYAKTCDTQSCQVYAGAAVRSTSAAVTSLEDRRSDRAIADTAGEVRKFPNGQLARTEYSASTGGYTAGGTFPAVVDEGDATAGNNNNNWKIDVPTADIEERYPQIGELRSIDVTARNGLGPWGGRVKTVAIRGSKATVSITGDQFRSNFNVKSDWFVVPASFTDVPAVGVATSSGQGYWIVARDGFVFNVNGAPFAGSMAGTRLNGAIQSIAAAANGQGYWLLGSDGGVFAFNAPFFGSTGDIKLAKPVVAMSATPTGKGYWFTATDGGVFAFGDAGFFGSMGGRFLAQAVVGMAATPSGKGYWLVASDGGVFAFGDAPFYGSTGGINLVKPIVAMAARPQGDGYWFVASDGGVFAFGAARFFGGTGGQAISAPIVGMSPTSTGLGYRLIASDGATYAFGDAS